MVTENLSGLSGKTPGGNDVYVLRDVVRSWLRTKKPRTRAKPLAYSLVRNQRISGYNRRSDQVSPLFNQWTVNTISLDNYVTIIPVDRMLVASRNLAVSRLQSKVAQNDFNLGVAGAEASKTVSHIAHTASRLAKAALALKKGNLSAAARALGVPSGRNASQQHVRRNAANYWLELQYGWKPLLKDIDNGCKTLADLLNQPNVDIFYAKGRAHVSDEQPYGFTTGSGTFRISGNLNLKTWVYTDTGVVYKIRNGDIRTAAMLGLTNPFSIVWELIPFSFVVDWFLPVGDFLAQISAYHGLEFVAGYETVMTKRIAWYEGVNTSPGGCLMFGGGAKVLRTSVERKLLAGFPYKALTPKDPFSALHAFNAIALVQSIFGSYPPLRRNFRYGG